VYESQRPALELTPATGNRLASASN